MNPDEHGPTEEQLTPWLIAWDEALAAGTPFPVANLAGTPPELRPRLERGLECLQLLEEVWPRRKQAGADGEGPKAVAQREPAPMGAADPAHAPTELGRFQIRRELGRGTFGIVYLAYDPRLGREVALKIPRAEIMADPHLRQRFRREARAAAVLDHPNLVPVYDAGEVGSVCFIASAYCPGVTLADWLKQRAEPVPYNLAAQLVRVLAEAVHYAHQRGVVHRDLKPANVLLQEIATKNTKSHKNKEEEIEAGSLDPFFCDFSCFSWPFLPKITDFGLAKLLPMEPGLSAPTQSGAILGTADYMAPEQAAGKAGRVGPPADLYALGVILYELLTGRTPFQGDSALDVLLRVRTEEPLAPGRLRRNVPRDLETICLKCLHKEPGRRYANAGELAEDVRRFLAGEPIRARPVRAWERVGKWARRRPAIAGLLASVVLVTALGFAGVAWQWREAEAARRELAGKADALESKQREVADKAETLETNLYYERIALAERELKRGFGSRADELLEQCPSRLRGWEWHYLKRLPFAHFPPRSHDSFVIRVAFSPDGAHLASGDLNGNVKIWDARKGKEPQCIRAHDRQIWALAFSPNGRRLATGSREVHGVKVWDVSTRRLLCSFSGHTDRIEGLVFSPDGQRLASASRDRTVRLWDLRSGQAIRTYRGHEWPIAPNGLAFGADGRRLTSVSVDGVVKVWEAATDVKVRTFRGDVAWAACAAFTRDGRFLALGAENGAVKVYQTEPWEEVRSLEAHPSLVRYLALSPDGRRLASTGEDLTLKIWDVTTGHEALLLDIHTNKVTSVAFSPDGHRLASGSADNTVKVSDGTPWEGPRNAETGVFTAARFTWTAHDHKVVDLAYSADGQRLVSAGWDHTVKVWGLHSGKQAAAPRLLLQVTGLPAGLTVVAFSADGRLFAVASLDGTITFCDAASGQKLRTLRAKAGPVYGVAFHPVRQVLASAHYDGTVKVWDIERALAGGKNPLIRTIVAHTDTVLGVAYSPDGQRLASAGARDLERDVGVWEAATGKPIRRFHHGVFIRGVAFSPDGKRLASLSAHHIRLWDLATGQQLFTIPLADHSYRVAFSPDGRRLATVGEGQSVWLWDAATGRNLFSLRVSGGQLGGAAFSPDGRSLATCSGYKGKGTIQIWDVN
jgi:WD40 repeat protein